MSKADNKELEEAIKRALKEKNRGTATIGVEVLETILNELERLQEENNKLEKANKIYINSIQSITPVLLKDYIEKDKIREKIEELKKEQVKVKNNKLIYSREDVFRFQIYILEEI